MNTTLVHQVTTKFNFSGSSIKVSDLETASCQVRKIIKIPCSREKSESKLYVFNCHFDILTI